MPIFLKQLGSYLVSVCAGAMLIITNINAMETSTQSTSWTIDDELKTFVMQDVHKINGMESSFESESYQHEDELFSSDASEESLCESMIMCQDESSMVYDSVITEELLFLDKRMFRLVREFFVMRELPHVILYDLLRLQAIAISCYLKVTQNKPDVVLRLIDHVYKNYGHTISVVLLSMALKHAKIWIGHINDWKSSCLDIACEKSDKTIDYLNCIKIILDIGGDTAWDLINVRSNYCNAFSTRWHIAASDNQEDIIDTFIEWAKANDKLSDLLLFTPGYSKLTALYLAAINYRIEIFGKLLGLADTIPGLVKTLLEHEVDLESSHCVLRFGVMIQNREKILEIMQRYCKKYELNELFLQLKEL